MTRTWATALMAALLVAACGPDVRDVSTVGVEAGEVVRTVAAPAVIDAAASVEIRAPVAGTIVELPVVEATTVEAGSVVVVLASQSVELQQEQAQAALDAAEALVNAAGSITGDVSPLIGALRIQLDTTFPAVIAGLEAQVQLSETTGGLVDPEARAAASQAREQLRELEAGFAQAREDLAALERQARQQAAQASGFQLSAAQAQRIQAALALQAAQSRADSLVIVTPITGLVEFGDRQLAPSPGLDLDALGPIAGLGGVAGFEIPGLTGGAAGPSASGMPLAVGEQVRAGEHLMTIFDLSGFIVRLDVDELDIIDVELGQPVTVRVDAVPAAELDGTIVAIAQAPQRRGALGATYSVGVALDGADGVPLRVGMTAAAEIEVERRTAPLTVPTGALLRRGDDDVIRVVDDGIVREVIVRVLLLGDERAVIDGDLRAGQRVVVGGLADVTGGDRVRDLAQR